MESWTICSEDNSWITRPKNIPYDEYKKWYSGVEHKLYITDVPEFYFWSNGYTWGSCRVSATEAAIEVMGGDLYLKEMRVGKQKHCLKGGKWISEGGTFSLQIC